MAKKNLTEIKGLSTFRKKKKTEKKKYKFTTNILVSDSLVVNFNKYLIF